MTEDKKMEESIKSFATWAERMIAAYPQAPENITLPFIGFTQTQLGKNAETKK